MVRYTDDTMTAIVRVMLVGIAVIMLINWLVRQFKR